MRRKSYRRGSNNRNPTIWHECAGGEYCGDKESNENKVNFHEYVKGISEVV
jgi:hypothetical protein